MIEHQRRISILCSFVSASVLSIVASSSLAQAPPGETGGFPPFKPEIHDTRMEEAYEHVRELFEGSRESEDRVDQEIQKRARDWAELFKQWDRCRMNIENAKHSAGETTEDYIAKQKKRMQQLEEKMRAQERLLERAETLRAQRPELEALEQQLDEVNKRIQELLQEHSELADAAAARREEILEELRHLKVRTAGEEEDPEVVAAENEAVERRREELLEEYKSIAGHPGFRPDEGRRIERELQEARALKELLEAQLARATDVERAKTAPVSMAETQTDENDARCPLYTVSALMNYWHKKDPNNPAATIEELFEKAKERGIVETYTTEEGAARTCGNHPGIHHEGREGVRHSEAACQRRGSRLGAGALCHVVGEHGPHALRHHARRREVSEPWPLPQWRQTCTVRATAAVSLLQPSAETVNSQCPVC